MGVGVAEESCGGVLLDLLEALALVALEDVVGTDQIEHDALKPGVANAFAEAGGFVGGHGGPLDLTAPQAAGLGIELLDHGLDVLDTDLAGPGAAYLGALLLEESAQGAGKGLELAGRVDDVGVGKRRFHAFLQSALDFPQRQGPPFSTSFASQDAAPNGFVACEPVSQRELAVSDCRADVLLLATHWHVDAFVPTRTDVAPNGSHVATEQKAKSSWVNRLPWSRAASVRCRIRRCLTSPASPHVPVWSSSCENTSRRTCISRQRSNGLPAPTPTATHS